MDIKENEIQVKTAEVFIKCPHCGEMVNIDSNEIIKTPITFGNTEGRMYGYDEARSVNLKVYANIQLQLSSGGTYSDDDNPFEGEIIIGFVCPKCKESTKKIITY